MLTISTLIDFSPSKNPIYQIWKKNSLQHSQSIWSQIQSTIRLTNPKIGFALPIILYHMNSHTTHDKLWWFLIQTFKCFTLNQIQIVGLLHNSTFEATTQSLQVSAIDVKHKITHFTSSHKWFSFQITEKNAHNTLANDEPFFTDNNNIDSFSSGRQSVIWPENSQKITNQAIDVWRVVVLVRLR